MSLTEADDDRRSEWELAEGIADVEKETRPQGARSRDSARTK